MVSRYLGGARTSDLHVLSLEKIDTAQWTGAVVLRPKTKGSGVAATRLGDPRGTGHGAGVLVAIGGQPRESPGLPAQGGQARRQTSAQDEPRPRAAKGTMGGSRAARDHQGRVRAADRHRADAASRLSLVQGVRS